MKHIKDLDYKDAERVKVLRATLRTLRCRLTRIEQAPPQKLVTTNVTRMALIREDIVTAQAELDTLLDDRLPSEEIGG